MLTETILLNMGDKKYMDLTRIENLSKINIPENLKDEVSEKFAEIIEFVDKLKKTENISCNDESIVTTREDVVEEYEENNLLLNSPQTKDNYIYIPVN